MSSLSQDIRRRLIENGCGLARDIVDAVEEAVKHSQGIPITPKTSAKPETTSTGAGVTDSNSNSPKIPEIRDLKEKKGKGKAEL